VVDGPRDEIQIRGLELLAFCGVLDEEQARRQPFRLDIDLHADLTAAGRSDDLHDTVDYGAVADRVVEVLAAERYVLVERMAARVVELALEWPSVEAVTVRVQKLRPPIAHHAASTGVRIHRRRRAGDD
jgi:dihydroneopterin aldolase/2-amino-4-hydroxy-6-hydroxymethyldihydropteridine diphosphokinase